MRRALRKFWLPPLLSFLALAVLFTAVLFLATLFFAVAFGAAAAFGAVTFLAVVLRVAVFLAAPAAAAVFLRAGAGNALIATVSIGATRSAVAGRAGLRRRDGAATRTSSRGALRLGGGASVAISPFFGRFHGASARFGGGGEFSPVGCAPPPPSTRMM